MSRFRKFVDDWNRKNLTPLSSDVDDSFETWINNTPYPQARKDELKKVYNESFGLITEENIIQFDRHGNQIVNKHCRVNSFVKDETYNKYKSARSINSRTDVFKVRVAPMFKQIENVLFKMKWFIKHTPVDERATEILRELYQDGAHIIGTDYTAYEAIFTKEYMETVEFQLYKYMTQNVADTEWYNIVSKTLSGSNWCQYRCGFTLKVDATRMSGEMCTSLGNSYSNLMAMLFIAEENKLSKLKGRVEGDDGIFTFYGDPPTAKDFADIGMIIKIEEYDSLTEGSFCGIIANEHELINITDPIGYLLDFGWTTRPYAMAKKKKHMELLRAKSMSLAYQYPGCPILSSLAKYGLRMTEGYHYNTGSMDEYHKEKFNALRRKFHDKLPVKVTGFETRMLVEKRYGVSIADQIAIESYLDNKSELSPLEHPAIVSNSHPDAVDYYDKYVFLFNETENLVSPIAENYGLEITESIFEIYAENEENTKDEKASETFKKAEAGSTNKGYRTIEEKESNAKTQTNELRFDGVKRVGMVTK